MTPLHIRATATVPVAQRGVAMIIVLLALLLLMIGAVAMLRAVDTSSIMSGNIAFRRDLTNRAERGIVTARALLASGALASDAARTANLVSANYSASKLANGSSGMPLLLTSDSAFTTAGMTAADLSDDEVTVRYVIDRQCVAAGTFSDSSCELQSSSSDAGGSSWLRKPGGEARPLYRISVRVKGPRNVEAYFQTTYAY